MPEHKLILTTKRIMRSGLKVQVLIGEWWIFISDIGHVQCQCRFVVRKSVVVVQIHCRVRVDHRIEGLCRCFVIGVLINVPNDGPGTVPIVTPAECEVGTLLR